MQRAFVDAIPIVVGYFSISVAFGVLAKDIIGSWAIVMSAAVFAGASQFIALQMLSKSASAPLIILTTFLVNLRHILMSSYLSTFYRKVSRIKRTLVAFGITDETFAIASRRFNEGKADFSYNIRLNLLCYASWIAGTAVGVYIPIVPGTFVSVLPFALTAFFICILVLSINSKLDAIVAVVAGAVATALAYLPTGWNIIVASLVACAFGGVAERWME